MHISINIVIIMIKAEHVWNQYSWWWNGMKWEQWLILSYLLQNVVLQSSSFEQSGHNKMHKKIIIMTLLNTCICFHLVFKTYIYLNLSEKKMLFKLKVSTR